MSICILCTFVYLTIHLSLGPKTGFKYKSFLSRLNILLLHCQGWTIYTFYICWDMRQDIFFDSEYRNIKIWHNCCLFQVFKWCIMCLYPLSHYIHITDDYYNCFISLCKYVWKLETLQYYSNIQVFDQQIHMIYKCVFVMLLAR